MSGDDARSAHARDQPSAQGRVPAIIEVSKVSHAFGQLEVLRELDFAVDTGEVFGVVGPSGCGKSTLLRIMAGLIAPGQGSVRLHGEPVRGPGEGSVLIFQEYNKSLFPWKTVDGNVRAGAHGRKLETGEVERVLRLVHLESHRWRFPWELSGGMQQRVALARALLRGPRVLLMDEPFGSLDGLTRYGLQHELLRWARQLGVTLVLVTHDLDEATFLCHRIAVLSGRPATVRDIVDVRLPEPRHPVRTRRDPGFARVRTDLQERLAPGDGV